MAIVTADELLVMPEREHSYELINGELREVPFNGGLHGAMSGNVSWLLWDYLRSRELGFVLGGGTGFILSRDPDMVRCPDVAFMTTERWAAQPNPAGFLEGAPDLAVEIVSRDDLSSEVHGKVLHWLGGGASLVWVIHIDQLMVTVYWSDGSVTTLGVGDTLTAEPVFADFSVPVAAIFE